MKVPFLIGRAVFGGFFLYNGINHFTQRKALAQYAGAKNVPLPEAAVVASGVALVIGGASILAGVKPKYGAAAIVGFLAGVSPVIHDFWSVEDPNQRMQEMVHFSKNLALLGGAPGTDGRRGTVAHDLTRRATLEAGASAQFRQETIGGLVALHAIHRLRKMGSGAPDQLSED